MQFTIYIPLFLQAVAVWCRKLVCAGEVLAKNRLFLIMSGIVHNFTIKPKSETEKPDHDPRNYVSGFIMNPKNYEVCAVPTKV